MSDSGWAEKTARKFQHSLSEKSQKDATFLEEQRIRRDYTERLWQEIRTAFNEKYMSINSEMKREVLTLEPQIGSPSFSLRRSEPQLEQVTVTCDQNSYSIKVVSSAHRVNFEVRVDKESGEGYLANTFDGSRRDPSAVAESVIENLLQTP